MKELTIEQKAQRYDEAIEVIKNLVGAGLVYEDAAIQIFPELKESEDERVKKAMIDFFKHERVEGVSTYHYGVNIERMIAWLEKQGENNMGISEATKKKLEDNLNKALEKETTESLNDFLKKQGEQKPTEWSEEDGKMLRFIGNAITADDASIYLKSKGIQVIDAHIWLEELKDRVQPKQEWSEEDNQYLCGLIGLIEQSKAEIPITLKGKAADNCINWLKSLRPQNRWKPTEEQIMVVSRLRHCFLSDVSGNDIVILDTLLEQLKELYSYDRQR